MAYHADAPWLPLTEDDHAAWVATATLIFFVYATFGVIAKLFIRFRVRGFQPNDYALLAAMVFFTIAVACLLRGCTIGLGRHQTALTAEALVEFSKLYYCSYLASMVASTCSRLSICLQFHAINSFGRFESANYALGSLILLSGLSGTIAASFQCRLPSPWLMQSADACPARYAIYLFVHITSILMDVGLTVLTIAMLWRVRMTIGVKCRVIALFSTRVLVPAVTIPCLTTAHDFLHDYSDLTWSAVWPTIWLQISTGLSILTACIPSLKAVLDSWLGHVGSAPMDVPYELERRDGVTVVKASATDVYDGGTAAPASLGSRDHGHWTRRLDELDGLAILNERPPSTGESARRLTGEPRSDPASDARASSDGAHGSVSSLLTEGDPGKIS